MKYDFSGWATRNNLKCSDGRTIQKDAFRDNDGQTVPLVWNHQHDGPHNILGHALLENRTDGVYAYCSFNDTEAGKAGKLIVEHGDVCALSIYANQLRQQGGNVMHGNIREVSLVLAGANPGAYIDSVISHGEESDEEAIFSFVFDEYGISHADSETDKEKDDDDEAEETIADVFNTLSEKQKTVIYALIGQILEDNKTDQSVSHSNTEDSNEDNDGETIADVFNTLSEKQKTVVYALIGQILEDNETGGETMKHNIFESEGMTKEAVLSHSDQEEILATAKSSSCGSLRDALQIYAENSGNEVITHGFEEIDSLFPEFEDVRTGAPELITRDQGWVGTVMQKVHKSPISRIRTRQMDARGDTLRGLGYKQKGTEKKDMANVKLLKRTTDPQTVYIKDKLDRDDIVDITDFDVVAYEYNIMKTMLNEELAMAIMVGDQREDVDESKISPDHIRPIWTDDDLYCIHADVDVEAAKKELQGSNTGVNFGENYIYAEAIISAALYAREKFKGSGTPDFYCTPHLLNLMLLARDLNGRRIYSSKSELAAALNVGEIYTAEQFEGLERKDNMSKKHKLLGIFVNLADYYVGSTKGGEITRFNQFDIDFNQEKYLIETRLSGALTRIYSAIALEEPVADP